MKKGSQVLVAVVIAVSLFSCNVIDITKKRYSNGYYISTSSNRNVEGKAKDAVSKEKASDINVVAKQNKVEQSATVSTQDNVVTIENNKETSIANSTGDSKSASAKIKSTRAKKQIQTTNNKPVFAVKSSKLAVSLLQMKEQKAIEKQSKSDKRDGGVHLLLLFILAILLPPLAVFLKKGLGLMFLLSLILTLLFILPGVIFALLVVFDVL